MKPENEFLDPPVFIISAPDLPFLGMGIGRGADLALEEDFVGEDGPSERRFWI